ncbi:trehalose-phosphatase [Nafulsella turpanensis]|uniref:trehalose-phosphatase n=1 Tax=Nafulsella turpanensis TaxID=1265690 RepID=UPI000345DC93|nr:trehalose-phosphatase [Nafulsella turpanensis]
MEQHTNSKEPASLPHAIEELTALTREIGDKKPVLFLDYDGTLSPIVKNPEEALLSQKTKTCLQELAEIVPIAVVSGRDRADVKNKVGLENLIYAGSHGFDITGPNGLNMQYEGGEKAIPALDAAEKSLKEKLGNIEGAWVERKKYAIAVHYRNVAEEKEETVKKAVEEVINRQEKLKKGGGKKILELKPNIDWHKGRATLWLLDALELNDGKHTPLFIGDDVTDEDALEAIAGRGIGILVGTHGQTTAASYRLKDTEEVAEFLGKLQQLLSERGKG